MIIAIVAFIFIHNEGWRSDEGNNMKVIRKLVMDDFDIIGYTTVVPGYHFVTAWFLKLMNINKTKIYDVAASRFVTLLISLITLFFFWRLAVMISPNYSDIKLLQFFFFPTIFSFFYLVYTDVLSLLWVLVTMFLLFERKYLLCGVTAIISVAIRQNNIVWFIFPCLYIFFTHYSQSIIISKNKVFLQMMSLWQYLKQIKVFLIGLVLFAIFVYINKGVSMGDHATHPVTLSLTNTYFCLFLSFIFFLPLHINNLSKVQTLLTKHKELVLISILAFIISLVNFKITHRLNLLDGVQDFWLRNVMLHYLMNNLVLKIIFSFGVVYSILSLAVTELHRKIFYLLYPITLIFLSLSWMIEPRYYFIPFTLFILFKKESTQLVEKSTLVIFICISTILFCGIKNALFFI